MLKMLKKIMKQGTATEDYFMSPVPARFRGRIEVEDKKCRDCRNMERQCGGLIVSVEGFSISGVRGRIAAPRGKEVVL